MAGRIVNVSRSFSTAKALKDSLKEPLKTSNIQSNPHEGGADLWKKVFFFLGCPAMAVAYINVQMSEKPKPPEFVKYQHLRIRNKRYPWRDGVKTLFHNPHTNPLPDGYETAHH